MRPPRIYRGHPAAWAEACRRGRFTQPDLVAATGAQQSRISVIVNEWCAVGAAAAVDLDGQRTVYEVRDRSVFDLLVPAGGRAITAAPASRQQTVEFNTWTAMRQMATFDPRDLAVSASTEDLTVTEDQAAAYCRALLKFGYLRVARKAVPGKRLPLYRLLRNTGPRPPRLRRVTGLEDPNTGAFKLAEGRA